ncbi:Metalloenzyme, LuxS/M16 peptidase-like protein [Dichotomocladium elegans]|nr:Metalloenzyme, LuxS/M16 peptidase-like protein [Dichotomocladium elegans]
MVTRSLSDAWSASQDGTHYVFTKPIESPAIDDRAYRLIRLANQLEVLLISDPDTDRASAALDVHVGNLSDPDYLEGLAHFCEHLLFMGTKKYPKENDYYSYLSEHSGYANAFTGAENTNYFFEVGHQWLEGALDRFSRFFIDPLFSESCTDRELRAVDSEHKKNLQSDCWRIAQVEKTLSNPNHPWRHFETGNLETLSEGPKRRGVDVRQELLKFHQTYYSANIMKLCVLGQEPLDQLAKWVIEKFSQVKNKNIPIPEFEGHPLTANELKKQIFVKSIKCNRTLNITFPLPDPNLHFESQASFSISIPTNYLSHLIGHEGPGSALSYLKKKGWVTYLSSGNCYGGRGFGFFHVSTDLTEEGLPHYEEVVVAIFQYIEMLKKVGATRWIFDEVQSLAAMEFRFSEKYPASQYTSLLAQQMQIGYPPEWTISGSALVRSYNPELINEYLSLLRTDNFRLTLASQTFPDGIDCNQVERWYGTEYRALPISQRLEEALCDLVPNESLHLPSRNEFIPTNLDVTRFIVEKKQDKPNLIQETPMLRLWHKKDDRFWHPKSCVWINFRNPLTYATPRNAVITNLYTRLIDDSLTEYSYNADVAGLSYYFVTGSTGIELSIGGYSDKLPLLLNKVIQRMKAIRIDADRFKVRRNNHNFFVEPPFHHASYYLTYAISEKMWKADDLNRELEDITLQDVQSFYPTILSHLHIESLVHGSIDEDHAIQMLRAVQDILAARPLMPSQFISTRSVNLPAGQSFVYQIPVHDADNVNSAIEYYCQICEVTDIPLRARLSLVAQIAQEPCFNQLRTKEQLGYLVFSGVRRHIGTMGLRFIIQSEQNTVYLENRVEQFLDTLRTIIMNLTDAEYAAQRDSLIADKQEKPTNMGQEGSKYWNDIDSGYYEFDDVDKDVKELLQVDKASLLEFYNLYIHPSSPQFRKLSIHLQSQRQPVVAKPKITVESLHACLATKSPAGEQQYMIGLEELKRAVATDINAGLPAERVLRKLLVDELKAKEEDIETVMRRLAKESALDLDLGNDEKPDTSLITRDHTRLPRNNIIITDLCKFKNQMPLSPAAVPFFLFSRI